MDVLEVLHVLALAIQTISSKLMTTIMPIYFFLLFAFSLHSSFSKSFLEMPYEDLPRIQVCQQICV